MDDNTSGKSESDDIKQDMVKIEQSGLALFDMEEANSYLTNGHMQTNGGIVESPDEAQLQVCKIILLLFFQLSHDKYIIACKIKTCATKVKFSFKVDL